MKTLEFNFQSPWEFVEGFYPNFDTDPEIKRNNLLMVIWDIVGLQDPKNIDALHLFNNEFFLDYDKADIALSISNEKVYNKAIETYIKQHEPTLENTWGFVEKYLQGYYQDGNVARSNDLSVIIETEGNPEDDSCAYSLLTDELDGDWKQAHQELLIVDAQIYEQAVEGFNSGENNHGN